METGIKTVRKWAAVLRWHISWEVQKLRSRTNILSTKTGFLFRDAGRVVKVRWRQWNSKSPGIKLLYFSVLIFSLVIIILIVSAIVSQLPTSLILLIIAGVLFPVSYILFSFSKQLLIVGDRVEDEIRNSR